MNSQRTLTVLIAVLTLIMITKNAGADPSKVALQRPEKDLHMLVPLTRDVPPLSAEVLTISREGSIDPATNTVNELTVVVVRHIDPRPDKPPFDPSVPHSFAMVVPPAIVAKGDIVQLERLPVPEIFSYLTNPDKPESRQTRPVEYVARVITKQVVLR